jgi:hypothetical protein
MANNSNIMKKLILILTVAALVSSCKKNNGNSGGNNTPVSANKDIDNYFTIDGVTNYHYTFPNFPTVSYSGIPNQQETAQWANSNPNEPDYFAQINLQQMKFQGFNDTSWNCLLSLSYKVNNTTKNYARSLSTKKLLFTRSIVNGNYVFNFNNIKVYEGNGLDSTGIFKYVSGKITCNGK